MPSADEIDAIAGKRESAQREMERRIVAQMLTCMDDLSSAQPAAAARKESEYAEAAAGEEDALPGKHVMVIGEHIIAVVIVALSMVLGVSLQYG